MFCKEIEYLRNVIALEKLWAVKETTEAVALLQYPATVSELRSFFGLCKMFCTVATKFVKLTFLLNRKLEKVDPLQFKLDDEEHKVVVVLKKKLRSSLILALTKLESQ